MTQLKGLVLSGRGDTQSLTQRIQAIETQLSGLANGHPPSSGSTSSSPPLPSMIPSFSSSPPLLSSSPGSLPLTGDGERVEQLQVWEGTGRSLSFFVVVVSPLTFLLPSYRDKSPSPVKEISKSKIIQPIPLATAKMTSKNKDFSLEVWPFLPFVGLFFTPFHQGL